MARWYEIVRFYRDPKRENEVIRRNVLLFDAQAHCSDPQSCKEGEWFDGYRVQQECTTHA